MSFFKQAENLFGELTKQLEQLEKEEQEYLSEKEEKSAFELTEELAQIQNKREAQTKAEELLQDIYIKTAENVCKSESLRTEISKDDFSDKDKVIDTLLYTVGLLTKDVLFYQSNVSKLKGHKPIYKA